MLKSYNKFKSNMKVNLMKCQFFAAILTVPAFALGTTAAFTQPRTATPVNVACNKNVSTPTIIATVSDRGLSEEVTMLSFLPKYFSPQAAVENCQTTADILQALYSTNKANYLTSDILNEQPVICALERRGSRCDSYSAQVLFTLKQTAEPSQALYDMLGSNFKQSQLPDSRTVSRIYTDIKPRRWWPF